MADRHPQPPEPTVERCAVICAELPDAREHEAWTGTSWRVRTATFTYVVEITDAWPPAYARAFGTDGPATVVTFQAAPDEYEALRGSPVLRTITRPGVRASSESWSTKPPTGPSSPSSSSTATASVVANPNRSLTSRVTACDRRCSAARRRGARAP